MKDLLGVVTGALFMASIAVSLVFVSWFISSWGSTTHTEEGSTNILLDRTSGAYRIDGDGCTAQEFAGGALVNINCQ